MMEIDKKTALILVDIQRDFCSGGALPVPEGDQVVGVANRLIARFTAQGLPVYATRDWHPADHCSFVGQGGTWPPHCVAGTNGGQFADGLALPEPVRIVSKAISSDQEAYSGFEGTDLEERLRREGVERLVVAGLATDYCVKNTVVDALERGFAVAVVREGVRAVNLDPEDGPKAEREMARRGAVLASLLEVTGED